jgi:pimeloyl-ACP methyl ester carboxylesterase
VIVCVAAVLSATCRSDYLDTWVDTSGHVERFVSISDGRLQYLDWGGNGPTLILIHGLGDNPHAFDDLAPALTSHFRVLACARRGHGRSFKQGPFDTATLVRDLIGLMDSLGIARAHFAGWSMGGNEITGIAGSHPERVDKIVYLDAGYDWADPALAAAFKAYPYNESRPADALKSLDAFREWHRRTYFSGVKDARRIEGYIRGLVEIQSDGSVRPLMSDSVAEQVNEALLTNQRDYVKVKAPALAIYATSFVDTAFGDSERQTKTRMWEENYIRPFRDMSVSRIQREISDVRIMSVGGTHADFFFNSREEVASAIISFLTSP